MDNKMSHLISSSSFNMDFVIVNCLNLRRGLRQICDVKLMNNVAVFILEGALKSMGPQGVPQQ